MRYIGESYMNAYHNAFISVYFCDDKGDKYDRRSSKEL